MGVDTCATTYLPFCFKNILEHLEGATSRDLLLFLIMIFAGTAILSKTTSFLQDLLFFPVINVTIREFHYKIAEHIHSISYKDYTELSIPEVVSIQKRIGMCVRFFLRALLVSIIPTFLKFGIAFAIIWQLNVFRMGLFLGLIFIFLLFYVTISWYLVLRDTAWNISDKVSLAIGDSLFNTKIVRFYKTFEMKRLRLLVDQESKSWFAMTLRMDIAQVFIGILIGGMMSALIGMSAFRVYEKTMSLGQFVLLNGQLTALFIPIRQTLTDLRQIFEASIDFGKIADILSISTDEKTTKSDFSNTLGKSNRRHEEKDALSPMDDYNLENQVKRQSSSISFNFQDENCITFSKVNFSYENDQMLFTDFSFSLKPYQKTLIYGKSGEGKSTFLGLLTGLLTPQTGIIKIFGQDIRTLTLEDLGKILHYVPQDYQFFNGTLYENLTFGIEDPKEHNINQALQKTELFDFVKALPKGLATPIGEMGSKVSGGERQRIALARSLLHKPKILIFDEATNAMDKMTEKKVFDQVSKEIPTILFIAHKGYFNSAIDEIYEMKKGVLKKSTTMPK